MVSDNPPYWARAVHNFGRGDGEPESKDSRTWLWLFVNSAGYLCHTVLRNALNNAEREELITRNVAKIVQIPTPRYKIGKSLPVSDVKRLLSAARRTRFYPVYVLAATLGLRRGELLGLRWNEIDLAKNTLQVARRCNACQVD